jgi:MraZ protein
VQVYHVRHEGETVREIARKTLGNADRWEDVVKLNPSMKPDTQLIEGVVVKLPAEACIPTEEVETVKPLPVLRKAPAARAKALPLTGTYPCNLDEKHTIALPKSIREQLGNCETVMVSPGPDQCLWVTNQAHLDRLAERLENSPAREAEVRVFKRLYYAQTERVTVSAEGRVQISERLAQFAGLAGEVVLVGIDDHFELWDVARWKQYTQQQSAAGRTVSLEE